MQHCITVGCILICIDCFGKFSLILKFSSIFVLFYQLKYVPLNSLIGGLKTDFFFYLNMLVEEFCKGCHPLG